MRIVRRRNADGIGCMLLVSVIDQEAKLWKVSDNGIAQTFAVLGDVH